MSRYTTRKENLTLCYGFDHVLGYWYDITDNKSLNEDGEPIIIEEKSSFFQSISKSEFYEILDRFNVREDHKKAVSLDLQF